MTFPFENSPKKYIKQQKEKKIMIGYEIIGYIHLRDIKKLVILTISY